MYWQHTQTNWSPVKMEVPHTVRQNIPLSRAIDRTNIKESPSPVPLSPQYVKAHPLDLQTPDPLLTPVVTSNIQRLQLPWHETTRIQTHALTHTWRTYMCTSTRAQGLEHKDSNTETDCRWVQGWPTDFEGLTVGAQLFPTYTVSFL